MKPHTVGVKRLVIRSVIGWMCGKLLAKDQANHSSQAPARITQELYHPFFLSLLLFRRVLTLSLCWAGSTSILKLFITNCDIVFSPTHFSSPLQLPSAWQVAEKLAAWLVTVWNPPRQWIVTEAPSMYTCFKASMATVFTAPGLPQLIAEMFRRNEFFFFF